MSDFLAEAFKELKLEELNEADFELTKDGLEKLDKFYDDDESSDEVVVYDDDLNNFDDEEEKVDYVGKKILDCNTCHSLTFVSDEDITIDEQTGEVNSEMECPYCHSYDGFTLVGKVCPCEEEKTEEEVEEKEEIDESCKSKKTKNELFDANLDLSNFGGQGNDVSVLSPGGGLSKMLPVGEELDDEEEDRREQRRKDRRKARRDVRRAKRTNEPVDESVKNEDHQADNVLTKYQRWVDYDMKKYGKISKITQKALDKAGFEVVKDDHGDYEVIANTNESCDKKVLKEDNYRGAKDVEFVSHGQWADPDLVYNGYTFNYWDIEDALWSMFLEDTGHKDSESGDPKVEEEFDKYVRDNVVSYLEDAIDGGYFAKGKKSWHESLNKKNVNEAPIYDLDSIFDSRQSFYGKAKVDTGDKGDKNKLYSYNTLVAEIKDGKPVVYGTYSQTTLRHIKEWLKQLGFKAENKAQIERDYLVKNESLEESFKDVTITTDDTHMEMTSDENGKVTVTTEPVCKECEEKEEVIEPLTDEDEVEIEKKSFDNENDDEVEVNFDEFDEETFESLTESFLKKTYNNVKSFKVNEEKDNGVSATKDGKIIVEGKITFNSGAQKDTKFIFEGHQATKRGKVKLIGENAQITNGKKAFTITGSIDNKKLVVESLNYNYRQKNPITHKADRIYGTVKKG